MNSQKTLLRYIAAAALAVLVLCGTAYAASSSVSDAAERDYHKTYGKLKTKVKLRPQDKKAAEIAKKQENDKNAPMPTAGVNGGVQFRFGSILPRILCKPLRVTDVELEPGENIVNAPFIGDSVNWSVLPSASGSGENMTYHIIIKPNMPDLNTNLIVHTDRRTYQLDLVSSNENYTPHVTFTYPDTENNNSSWENFFVSFGSNDPRKRLIKQEQEVYGTPLPAGRPTEPTAAKRGYKNSRRATAPIVATPKESANLNFDYRISPKKKGIEWTPLRVYDNGLKTFIDMPDNLMSIEAPVFMLLSPAGSREMVNYRLVDRTYVIDRLIKRGVLITGTGRDAQEVVIARLNKEQIKEKAEEAAKDAPKKKIVTKSDLINYLKGRSTSYTEE